MKSYITLKDLRLISHAVAWLNENGFTAVRIGNLPSFTYNSGSSEVMFYFRSGDGSYRDYQLLNLHEKILYLVKSNDEKEGIQL